MSSNENVRAPGSVSVYRIGGHHLYSVWLALVGIPSDCDERATVTLSVPEKRVIQIWFKRWQATGMDALVPRAQATDKDVGS